jgi:NAD-dependent deacetylase
MWMPATTTAVKRRPIMHPPVDGDLQVALEQAVQLLRRAERLAVLTGAGISAESGLPTFRGAGGLWEGQPVEKVATPEAFKREPRLVWSFYNARRAGVRAVRPNAGHEALVRFEERLGSEKFALITQNVDGLHRVAGSRRVLELHGNLQRVRCTACGIIEDRGLEELPELPKCCQCGQLLRPDIVWFGEMLPEDVWSEAQEVVRACQCLMVVGTSANVYPAAGLVLDARYAGASVIEVNLEKTPASHHADVSLLGPSGQVLPSLIAALTSEPEA